MSKDRALQLCFEDLCRAAVAGERCPMNGTHNVDSTAVSLLARLGKIKVQVYARNWRTVTILDGEHAGKSTKPAPDGYECYRVIDRHSRLVGVAAEDRASKIERQRAAIAAFREACAKYNEDQRKACVGKPKQTGGYP